MHIEIDKNKYKDFYYLGSIDLQPVRLESHPNWEYMDGEEVEWWYKRGYLFKTKEYALGISRCLRNIAFPEG